MSVYVTGDTHAEFTRFTSKFTKEFTKDDTVIICGDFGGIWYTHRPGHENGIKEEQYRLKWFEGKPYTILFVDGNHENFDRLYSDEFPIVDYKGGKAQKIAKNVYHLLRGQVYTIEGKKFFTFGGASSHDIQDGILYEEDYSSLSDLFKDYNRRTKHGEMLRINGISWWKQEMPTEEEMQTGLENLQKHNNKVDFIITHSPPQKICSRCGFHNSDILTKYLDQIAENTEFTEWYSGHLHMSMYDMDDKFNILYKEMAEIV